MLVLAREKTGAAEETAAIEGGLGRSHTYTLIEIRCKCKTNSPDLEMLLGSHHLLGGGLRYVYVQPFTLIEP